MKKLVAMIMMLVLTMNIEAAFIYSSENTEKQMEDETDERVTVCDIDGLGYVASNKENLIDITKFDYTCDSLYGWTSGGCNPTDNFYVGEGHDGNAVFAKDLGTSTAEGSINPYIPLPQFDDESVFILSFFAYAKTALDVEWSKIALYDENFNMTQVVKGEFDGKNYKYGVSCDENWKSNTVAFKPNESDKYIRIMIGWAEEIGIDDISIVKAEKNMVDVYDRYVDNTDAYEKEPTVLGKSAEPKKLQYGEYYTPKEIVEMIEYNGKEYVLISDKCARKVVSDNNVLFFDYKYVPKDELFEHPGVLNTQKDLERIAQKVTSGEEPYASEYEALKENAYAKVASPRAVETISRGGSGANCALLYTDIARAYFCAIRWKIDKDKVYGDCARDILNAWSYTLKNVTGNADRYLAAGLYGYELAAVSEIMRDYPQFERDRMQKMLIDVFYKPLNERFLYSNEYGGDHNGANISNYWANWDLCNMASAMAIGVFCDRRDIYERAENYFKYGAGNGSIYNAVPKIYEAIESCYNISIGQWQEAGRDMPHTELGIGLMATVCEIAWNQGDDLYGWANNRFMYAAEYIAQYEIGNDVPFTIYNWRTGTGWGKWSEHSVIAGRSGTRSVWEMVYNHYVNRLGYKLPGIEAIAEKNRPEPGPGSHASNFDYFGFGTLLYTREYDENIEKAKLPDGNIREGVYKIAAKHSGGVLTDRNGEVRQCESESDNPYQLWNVCDMGGGVYTLINVGSQNVLSVEDESYSNGALLKTKKYSGLFSQQFAFLNFDDESDNYYGGYYRIVPYHSGLCVDVLNASVQDDTPVLQYTYLTGDNQKWEMILVEEKDIEVPKDGNVTINVKIENKNDDVAEFYVYNAVFDEENVLTYLQRKKLILEPFEKTHKEYNVWADEKEKVKSFVWNSTMTPEM